MTGTFTTTGDMISRAFSTGSACNCQPDAHTRFFNAASPTGRSRATSVGDAFHDTDGDKDPKAEPPDAFTLRSEPTTTTCEMAFPDLEGKSRTLADPAFSGKAKIIEVPVRGARTATTHRIIWPICIGECTVADFRSSVWRSS